MFGVPAYSLFNDALIWLATQKESIKLFESALYPISFIFTPNTAGFENFIPDNGCFGVSEGTYRNKLKVELAKFNPSNTQVVDYGKCNWIYYLLHAQGVQRMVLLLHQASQHEVKPKIKPESPEEPKATTTEKPKRKPTKKKAVAEEEVNEDILSNITSKKTTKTDDTVEDVADDEEEEAADN